ncbi:MAG: MFS transporter [Bacteroidales bacterium]|nr:MFS transporter [Bacteroidales bacterium]
MNNKSKMLTATILSMSLLTVMAAAAIAPAMGIIKEHFSNASDILVQLIISLPALSIIITNLFFMKISSFMRTRTIAIIGLLLYVVSGTTCFFLDNIYLILIMRALLGVSVGLIMPLSTGLLSYFYPPEEQARLMGLSSAMNQMGGVVGTLFAGFLSSIEWNYSFLVYLFGLVALLMIMKWLPNEKLETSNKRGKAFEPRQLLKFHPSIIGMLLLTMIFFVFPTNFAIISSRQLHLDTGTITLLMVALDLLAFFVGLIFGKLMRLFRNVIKYFPPLCMIIGYIFYAEANNITMLLVGSAFIGLGNGIGVPYLLTIASIKGGKNSATTVMPLISAALYLGQFISPIIMLSLSDILFTTNDIVGPYKVTVVISVIFLLQVFLTRKFQSLPPEDNGK